MNRKRQAWLLALTLITGLLFYVELTAPKDVRAGISAPTTTSVAVRVAAASDDAEEAPSGDVSLNSTDLELVEATGGAQTVGMRFANVAIPAGATIVSATIQFQVDEATTGATQLTMAGQAADDAPTFDATNASISSRPRTAATASWWPPSWPNVGAAGARQRTPDIGAIVQEIIDRPGWSSGNSLAVVVTGSGNRTAEAYDGDPSGAPLLEVVYYTGAPPSTPTDTPARVGGAMSFAVIGDYGDGSPDEGLVAALVDGWNPDFVITTGDNNYPDGTAETIDVNIGQFYSQFIGNYAGAYGPGSPTNRFWPTLGNHDWRSLSCTGSNCSGPHFDYFTLPGNERYYDVDLGLVHLFAVDSDVLEPDGDRPGSVQGTWLQNELSASTACFDVVYFHHPPYSSGDHGSEKRMRWPFPDWGADVVMSGHEHSYERVDAGGFPYFVNGSGGKSLRNFTNIGTLPAGVTSEVRYKDDYGAMLVAVTNTAMKLQFFNTTSTLIDEYTINKDCDSVLEPAVYLPVVLTTHGDQALETMPGDRGGLSSPGGSAAGFVDLLALRPRGILINSLVQTAGVPRNQV